MYFNQNFYEENMVWILHSDFLRNYQTNSGLCNAFWRCEKECEIPREHVVSDRGIET